jgi:tetratricopeptide (TPR) repeat protein
LAIDLLKVKLDRISDDRYSLAIKQLLLSLYRVEGRDKEAVALAQELTKTISPNVPSRQPPSEQLPPGELRTQLDAAGFLIEKGQADRALLQIKLNLKHYSHGDLPKALLLAGKAQVLLAQKANAYKRRQLLLQGGLNFMRVGVFFPGFGEAPEALYQAGRVNAMLGNHQAAAKTYTLVIERYAKSGFADKAQAELAAMQNR